MTDQLPTDPTPDQIAQETARIREQGHLGKDGLWREPWPEKRYGRQERAGVVMVDAGEFYAAISDTRSQ